MSAHHIAHVAQQSAPSQGPGWVGVLWVVGIFAVAVVVREVAVWIIHHWPHSPTASGDSGARRPRDDADDHPDDAS